MHSPYVFIKRRRVAQGTPPLFLWAPTLSSIFNAPAPITINATEKDPTFAYNGNDAGTAWSPYNSYGSELSQILSGDAPSYNQGSPLIGGNDSSVLLNGGKIYGRDSTTYADIDGEDFCIEAIYCNTGAGVIASKRNGTTPDTGWALEYHSSGRYYLHLDDGVAATITLQSPAVASTAYSIWYHIFCIVDKSGSGIIYLNGNPGVAQSVAGLGSFSNTEKFAVGGYYDGQSVGSGHLAWLAMWKGTGWLDTHLQQTFVQNRFWKIAGAVARTATGTAEPNSFTRGSAATLTRRVDGVTTLYRVGEDWPRIETDPSGRVGYRAERQVHNACADTEAMENWSTAGVTTAASASHLAPIKPAASMCLVTENTATAVRNIYDPMWFSAGKQYLISVFVRPIDAEFLVLRASDSVTREVEFDLSDMSISIEDGGVGGVIDLGDGVYRLFMYWTETTFTTSGGMRVAFRKVSGVDSYTGTGRDLAAVWGGQAEGWASYPTSYIWVNVPTGIRAADSIEFKGDDGNLPDECIVTATATVGGLSGSATPEQRLFSASDGSANNMLEIHGDNEGKAVTIAKRAGVTQVNIDDSTTALMDDTAHSVQSTFTDAEGSHKVDGTAEGTPDTPPTGMPTGTDRFHVGEAVAGGDELMGLVHSIRVSEP